MDKVKVCKKCFKEKPANNEYFYKSTNKDGLQNMCKECAAKYAKEYGKEHRHEITANNQRRYQRTRELTHTLTKKQWIEIQQRFNYKCAYCGSEGKLEKDHVQPVYLNGDYTLANIVCVCHRCNSSKGNKPFVEWYHSQPFYDEQKEQEILNYLLKIKMFDIYLNYPETKIITTESSYKHNIFNKDRNWKNVVII